MVEDIFKVNLDIKIFVFVYVEIFMGVCNEVKVFCELVKKYDCFSIVDVVIFFGGIELDVDGWSIDVIYLGL